MTVLVGEMKFMDVYNDLNFNKLFSEYAAESAIEGLPHPSCSPEIYQQMEAGGKMTVFASYENGTLTGFLNLLVSVLPHYSALIATAESFFVGKEYRKGGSGVKLLKAAEEVAMGKGAKGFLVSAPTKSRLEKVLPRSGYTESNRIFFRGFNA